MKSPTGIVVAMKEEADILAAALNLTQTKKSGYFVYEKADLVMVTPGIDSRYLTNGTPVSRVGKVPAAAAVAVLINKYRPQVIFNLGTAGGVGKQGVKIGDIIVANSVMYHDIDIPLPGYNEYSTRQFGLSLAPFTMKGNYKVGLVSTGDSFTMSPTEKDKIYNAGALAKDMEAASVVETAKIISPKTAVFVIKVVTDLVDSELSENDFLENFNLAMATLSKVAQKVLLN